MSPRLLFWVPTTLRAALVLASVAGVGLLFGKVVALCALVLCLGAIILLQLQYLYRLSTWLDHPHSDNLPDGWGSWTDVFARLYRLRRLDEKNQTELTEWLTRFRQAMHLLPDGVAIMDDVLFLEWCNPAAERHLGLNLARDCNMRVTNLIRSPEFIDYIILGRYQQPLTFTHRGRKLIVQIIPFENRRQIMVTHDCTEADRIDMMRRDFIANASHELRTPLTVVVGFLEIALAQPKLDEATRQAHLKLMSEQAQRMQSLVQDMLTLSRLESVDYPLRIERVGFDALLTQLMQDARALSVGQHQIEQHVKGPDLKGNTDELMSAFGNLISNAVRYTPAGGKIDISWQETAQGLEFAVKDTGIGIRPEHLSRLTERFYRVDKSRSRETQGTGLGLAIVKHVLLRHGASLVIESEPERGSVFIARFPLTARWEAATLIGDGSA
jgi:two-component system phosphate regulon sensor histidine kinase PhoR